MPDAIESLCQLFADDAKIYASVNIRDDTNTIKLQKDLDRLSEWSRKWQLPFNTGKCKVLHIGTNNPCHRYKMDNKKLDNVSEEKDLGVLVDEDLKFHKQTAAAVKKANRSLGMIKKTLVSLNATTLPTLYKTLVRPHLKLANVAWGPHFKGDIKAVESIQKRATKLVKTLKDVPYENRLRSLNIPSLVHRRRRGDMIFTYKIFHDVFDINKESVFISPSRATRGHAHKIMKSKASMLTRITAYSNRIHDDWNSLPEEIVHADTVNSFKKGLDEHWTDEQFITP